MMKFHPLMTKELRKTYSLMASAAMRAMSAEFKYGVKKEFNKMSTALKAMRAKMKAEKAVYRPLTGEDSLGRLITGISSLHFLLMTLIFLNTLLVTIPLLLQGMKTMHLAGLLELQLTIKHTRSSLKTEEK